VPGWGAPVGQSSPPPNAAGNCQPTHTVVDMRRNEIGEAYCHTADEARGFIKAHGRPVHVRERCIQPESPLPESLDGLATAEVSDNWRDDLVCYIEAPTVETVRDIIAQLDLEVI
jgi:hypothetical protein